MNNCVSTFYWNQKPEMERMLKTLHYFHPEATEVIMNEADMLEKKILPTSYIYASVGKYLSNTYDTITHIDADVIIVDRLDELFDTNSDVRAGRNNSDNLKAGTNMAFTLKGLHPLQYVNVGIHSVTNKLFWEYWLNSCNHHGHKVPLGEQGVFNECFHDTRYKSVILDPIESPIHYGTSFQYGKQTHWDSWKGIIVKDNKLYINNKLIKMLHIAGGGKKPPLEQLVSKEVLDFINSIVYR